MNFKFLTLLLNPLNTYSILDMLVISSSYNKQYLIEVVPLGTVEFNDNPHYMGQERSQNAANKLINSGIRKTFAIKIINLY